MTDRKKLKDRARDELFSHINRCGVLQAAADDQEHWLDETMEYLTERYPDLNDAEIRELYTVGLRFCRPAIPHGRDEEEEGAAEAAVAEVEAAEESSEESSEVAPQTVAAGAEDSATPA